MLLACGFLIGVYARLCLTRWGQPHPMWDFSVFWEAARLTLAGKAAVAYDWTSLSGALAAEFGQPHPDPFFYPPTFLLLLAPLGLLSFATAAVVWIGTNIAAYLAGIRAILPGATAMLAALAAPLVLFNVVEGQNGLFLAGLLAGALAMLDTRPVISGLLIGLLTYKPHFGVLLPFFLAATGRWRVFASAAATVAALAVGAGTLLGWEVFAAFARQIPVAADDLVGNVWRARVVDWNDLESIYGMLRAIGIGAAGAWFGQIVIALAAAAVTLRIAAGRSRCAIKAAALATAAVIVTPYSELNDTAILMVPWAFLLRDGLLHGFARWEKVALGAAYALPLLYGLTMAAMDALWSAHLANGAGIAPAMCAILTAVIGCRIRRGTAGGVGDRLAAIAAARSGR